MRKIYFFVAVWLTCSGLQADPIAVRYREGTLRGFLGMKNTDGKAIAAGDLTQTVAGDRVTVKLTFRFTDGSLDDETTVFSQNKTFRMLSYRHIQKGPSFPESIDMTIDPAKKTATVKSVKDGKEKVDTEKIELPVDLANGLLPFIAKNLPNGAGEMKVGYVAATPKPRLVKLAIAPQGEAKFTAAGTPHQATHFVVKVEIGGVAGVVAPMVGKQPKDLHIWVLRGTAPAFVRLDGQLYQDGPVWEIGQASPIFQ